MAGKDESDLIVALSPALEDFIAELFGIAAQMSELKRRHDALAPLYGVKRLFVQRRAAKKYSPEQAAAFDGPALRRELERHLGGALTELRFAEKVEAWMKAEAEHAEAIELAARYAAWATHTPEGQRLHKGGVLFKVPHKVDPHHLVPVETEVVDGVAMLKLPPAHRRARDGFALTDPGMDLAGALDHANYCIWCHNQGKDSCSKGLKEKSGEFKKSPFGVVLAGCPLDEKISEMNLAEAEGHTVGALAITIIDNPMCAATGHRICNDCMKACIYQKQEPVDIPQIETRVLKEVLALPWGFEIYSLLTRWNPLNLRRPLPRPATGRKVLVVGLGPAGFTLAHHLMNDGHTVIGIDGLKIEPLPEDVSGVDPRGRRVPFRPIRDVAELREPLEARVMAGFGGVAEYGITVRWDKNFLKLIRLLLERRRDFTMFGGVRFGGTLTIDGAFALGFDHIALCAGAGRPTIVPMKNGLAAGVRQASDFLMALQLTGAAKTDSLANLQVRLPVVIIGGGLTAIDTATEALAYYPLQVEKFLSRYETLIAERGEAAVRADWSVHEAEAAAEFIDHARAIRAERAAAAREGRKPQLAELLRRWGGATIVYRRRLIDSPSYTLNHEEVAKALEEGISFAERLTPGRGAARPLRLGARVAAFIQRRGRQQPGRAADRHRHAGALDPGRRRHAAQHRARARGAAARDDRRQVFPGLRRGRPQGHARARHQAGGRACADERAAGRPRHQLLRRPASVLRGQRREGDGERQAGLSGGQPDAGQAGAIRRVAGYVDAAARRRAARERARGQPPHPDHRRGGGAGADGGARLPARAILSAAELRDAWRTPPTAPGWPRRGSRSPAPRSIAATVCSPPSCSRWAAPPTCARSFRPGEPVVLMGPTGHPTETPSDETVLLIGGGLGNAVLFSIGQALRANGSRVIYFAGYKRAIDRYKVEEIERAGDVIVWCCDAAPGFRPDRPQDRAFVGNIVEALDAYGSGALGDAPIPLGEVDRVIAIGSDGMMAAVARARQGILAQHLKPGHKAIASINSPMQCMMKEICAQCLQVQRDPESGVERVVFSCFNQDQDLDHVDFDNLRARLGQNGVQEKLTRLWIDRSLRQLGLRQPAAE